MFEAYYVVKILKNMHVHSATAHYRNHYVISVKVELFEKYRNYKVITWHKYRTDPK